MYRYEREHRRKKKIIRRLLAVLLFFVIAGAAFGVYAFRTRAHKQVIVEAGGSVEASDFSRNPRVTAHFADVSELDAVDFHKPGDYPVHIRTGLFTRECTLTVTDTVAPQGAFAEATVPAGEAVDAKTLVTDLRDETEVTAAFAEDIDFNAPGEKEVTIVLTDLGGNVTRLDGKLTILPPDTTPPVMNGVRDLFVFMDESVSYLQNVTVTDDTDAASDIKVDVETANVDLKTPGDYEIVYVATDRSGNETRQRATLHVQERTYEAEEVGRLAQELLQQITTPDMTQYQILEAIYNWCRGNIRYVNSSEKDTWEKAAYDGLYFHQGDCYTYACTSKALLTYAGIVNKDIEKIPAAERHYWNLVDIGEGWYHFDVTPRRGPGDDFCYVNDEFLMAYSVTHDDSHNYDREIYTDIQ